MVNTHTVQQQLAVHVLSTTGIVEEGRKQIKGMATSASGAHNHYYYILSGVSFFWFCIVLV